MIHSEDWFSFAAAEFEGPVGERMKRYIFHHPGAVGVVPIEDEKIVLVRQYRPALEMEMLEIQFGYHLKISMKLPGFATQPLWVPLTTIYHQ